MSKEKSNSENLPATITRSNLPDFLAEVEKKIKEIKSGLPDAPKTKGELKGYGKISDIKSVSQLTRAAASVILRAEYYAKAAQEIGTDLKKYPNKIDGHSVNSWLEDIKGRVVILSNKDQLDKLNAIKAKLEANLSAEDKLNRDMAEIAKILTD